MLTSKQLHYRVRAGRAHPQMLKLENPEDLQKSEQVLSLFKGAVGLTHSELERRIAQQWPKLNSVTEGLLKLVTDKCEYVDVDPEIAESRLAYILTSQEMRAANIFETKEAYQAAVAEQFSSSFPAISGEIYSDLHSERKIKAVPDFGPQWLLNRYNCAQFQGLILHADKIVVELLGVSMEQLRSFFRTLRFHQLLVKMDKMTKPRYYRVTIDGPSSMFSQSNRYGAKLANLFPHIVNLDNWKMEIELRLKGKELLLKVDSKKGLVSYLPKRQSYVPDEFRALAHKLAIKLKDDEVSFGSDFINLGDESYCFPDLTVKQKSGKIIYIELFHKWHAGQLVQRLKAWRQTPDIKMIFGVSREIDVDSALRDSMVDNPGHQQPNFFNFREFPTPKAVIDAISAYI